jgi:hypothetical protein
MDHFEVDKVHAAHRQLNVSIRLYFEVMRRVTNFLKHADRDQDEKLRCSLDDVEGLMMSAAMNAGELDGDSPSGYVFKLWYLAKWR